MKALASITVLVLLCGCATTDQGSTQAAGHQEAYEIYHGTAGNGISRHLVHSHTTALVSRPVSSVFHLSCRAWDHVWDTGRRLEVRLVRFPILSAGSIPDISTTTNGMDLAAWERHLDRFYGQNSSASRVDLLIDGESFYTALEEAIDTANRSIDLQIYLFDNDDVARALADRLRRRSNEVQVRIMFDGLGTYLSHTATADSQPHDSDFINNIPLYLCRDSNVQLRVIPNIWFAGDHVKNIIFDDHTAFIGGMNLGREYRHDWHDMMIRVEGQAAACLSRDFQAAWRRNGWSGDVSQLLTVLQKPATPNESERIPIRFLYTQPAHAQIYRAQLEAIRRSRKYIYIEQAYFADDRIIYELCRARKRGVDVRVILPDEGNHKILERSNRIAVNTLLSHGVRVYLYPGMSHVKAAVYDGWMCVGTANFDKLSLQINRELNLATSHPATVQQLLDSLFEPDFKISEELTEPIPLNLGDHLIELLADEV